MSEAQPDPSAHDDKTHVRGELDLSGARWERPAPEGVDPDTVPDAIEIAHVPHTDGITYTAMRQVNRPETVLVFTPAEWDAYVRGVVDGEFDHLD